MKQITLCKPKLVLSSQAYLKIRALVKETDSEVAWKGTAYKGEDEYFIDDIFVYPQYVTGATVDTEEDELLEWYNALDDNTFNNLRFQGHSHVNMGTSPSGTDERDQKTTMSMLDKDDFYIFLITNKKDDMNWFIYDKAKNLIYENSDIDFEIDYSSDILVKAKENIKTKKRVTKVETEESNFTKEDEEEFLNDMYEKFYGEDWRDKYGLI